MVKFGAHIEAVRNGDNLGTQLYLIPYNDIKIKIENEKDYQSDFVEVWHKELSSSEEDFRMARNEFWRRILGGIDKKHGKIRGFHSSNALQLYTDVVKDEEANQELLTRLTQILRAGTINSEGLRKLVKKFDKQKENNKISMELLPALYTSSLYTGLPVLQELTLLLRQNIKEDEDYSSSFNPMRRNDSEAYHARLNAIRMGEIDWLKDLVSSISEQDLLSRLVAHRGFHSFKGRHDKRPLENTLNAYEIAWTSGIHLCECDIAMTKDEKLVLAHDENFCRLALDVKSENSSKRVSDLTFRELISLPLKNGVRPPLLVDVLRSASAISEKAKLIIEIKPGNEAAASELARLLIRHPKLRSSVAMVMSFDATTMHLLRTILASRNSAVAQVLSTSRMSLSTSRPSMSQHKLSVDHYSPSYSPMVPLGLSLSEASLDGVPELRLSAAAQTTEPPFPKLMLLTVADPPNQACELQVALHELHRVDGWLNRDDGALDGVYLQFEKKMMTAEGAVFLRQLSERFCVGIWTYSGIDPDNYETFEWLAKEGNCTYINTDLPSDFRSERRRNSNASDFSYFDASNSWNATI